jgi:protein associated with RNAse G/E
MSSGSSLGSGGVEVLFSKWDGRPHRHTVERLLGADEYGTWLGSPVGSVVHYVNAGARVPARSPSVRLLPAGGWWSAIFFGGDREPALYCDVTTVAEWPSPGQVTMVDLDLDVELWRSGELKLLDEDEFAEHRVLFGYPDEVVVEAARAADFLVTAISTGQEPFATVWQSWLKQV